MEGLLRVNNQSVGGRNVYDFVICDGIEKLMQAIAAINYNSDTLVSVCQDGSTYTVFFRGYRRA